MAYRMRHRYLALSFMASRLLTRREIQEAIEKSVLTLYGAYGLSKIGPEIVHYDPEQKTAVVRCSRDQVIPLRASIANLCMVDGSDVTFFVSKVSGTLRSVRQNLEKNV